MAIITDEITVTTDVTRAGLGRNFRPGNLTLIQATQKKEAKM